MILMATMPTPCFFATKLVDVMLQNLPAKCQYMGFIQRIDAAFWHSRVARRLCARL